MPPHFCALPHSTSPLPPSSHLPLPLTSLSLSHALPPPPSSLSPPLPLSQARLPTSSVAAPPLASLPSSSTSPSRRPPMHYLPTSPPLARAPPRTAGKQAPAGREAMLRAAWIPVASGRGCREWCCRWQCPCPDPWRTGQAAIMIHDLWDTQRWFVFFF